MVYNRLRFRVNGASRGDNDVQDDFVPNETCTWAEWRLIQRGHRDSCFEIIVVSLTTTF